MTIIEIIYITLASMIMYQNIYTFYTRNSEKYWRPICIGELNFQTFLLIRCNNTD